MDEGWNPFLAHSVESLSHKYITASGSHRILYFLMVTDQMQLFSALPIPMIDRVHSLMVNLM